MQTDTCQEPAWTDPSWRDATCPVLSSTCSLSLSTQSKVPFLLSWNDSVRSADVCPATTFWKFRLVLLDDIPEDGRSDGNGRSDQTPIRSASSAARVENRPSSTTDLRLRELGLRPERSSSRWLVQNYRDSFLRHPHGPTKHLESVH